LAGEHRETEAAVRASGLAFTILRNGWYTENYTQSIPAAIKGGAFYGSAKDGKISSAARADYAAAAVVVLKAAADLKAGAASAYDGQTIELAGDSAYTLSDLAAELTKQLGSGSKVIPYTDLPAADYAKALAGFGLPAFLADAIASWDADASKGALFDDSKQLSKLIGRPTTTLAVSVAQAVKAAQASK
jgi:NAD(P)H dehydrogenase (quinone)